METREPRPEPTAAQPSSVPGVMAGERLLAEMREEIGRSDNKASILIGAVGVCSGVIASGAHVPGAAWAAFLWWAGCAGWVVALAFLLVATFPRYRRSRWQRDQPVTYFLDVRRAARTGQLPEALRNTEADPLAGLTIALDNTSAIITAKHRCIRAGLTAWALGAACLVTALASG
ncbi:hypothetical protein E1265_21935 [Streptomyces sp. 8K308]|uniref:Pycsar system effector family protein n=1 Tax=Streptomyces sp. 8K308 TaxID=2530388 RepID=UPI0010448A30|nr:Pycsar system effector family protein [Streptomyces sp. 8K308]TDC20497.1 hypothetical protein E1265_21935 [Streptomyces sp. 8K308]